MGFILLPAYNLCKLSVFSLLLLLNCVITVYTYVTLNVQPDIIRINQNINITCTVHGIDIINSNLTRQWSKGPDLICYNGHPIDSIKYTEILTARNQFKLQIKNISESDVNYKYQCRYGFDAQAKNIQASKDTFEYPPTDDLRAIVHQNESDTLLTVNLHFKKVFPLPICKAVIEGSSLPFNITSSKSVGNYYEVMLRHQSKDKLHDNCNGKVVVKCKLIKEYIIPTRDLRRCLNVEDNTQTDLKVVIPVTLCPILVLAIIISFLIKCKLRKTEKGKDELEISKYFKRKLPCIASHKKESSTSSCVYCNYSDQCSDQTEVCFSSKKDKEISSNIQITEMFINNSENQNDFGNMDHVEVNVSCLSTELVEDKCTHS